MRTSIASVLLAGLCIASFVVNAAPVSPKVMVRGEKPISPLILSNLWTIAVDVSDPQLMFNAEYLRDHLLAEFGLQLQIGPYVLDNNAIQTGNAIVLGKVSNANVSCDIEPV